MSDLRPISKGSIATRSGMIFTCDYGRDVGNLHIIDYYLTLCAAEIDAWTGLTPPHLRISPADWSRS